MNRSENASSLLKTVERLAPLVREHADQSESERKLAAPLAKAFRDSGLFKLCRPKELGGLEADPLTAIEVIEELARSDGSAAWCVMISGAGGAFEGFIPPSGAKEMMKTKDAVVGGVFAPGGRAIEVDGGYRISGRWAVASNCNHCDWLGGTSVVFDGQAPRMTPMGPESIVPLMAASDCRIIDTWNVSGLRGTGSHDFEVADVFVPRDRCIRIPMMESPYEGRLFAFPFFGFLSAAITSVSLGIARSAIDEFARLAKTKTPFGMQSSLATRATAQIALAEAEAEVGAARAFLHQVVGDVWSSVNAKQPISPQKRAMLRAAATNATTSAARAVDRMYTAAGATAIYTKSPLQRCFRDVHAITQHVFVAPTTNELIGKILLGVEPDAPLL